MLQDTKRNESVLTRILLAHIVFSVFFYDNNDALFSSRSARWNGISPGLFLNILYCFQSRRSINYILLYPRSVTSARSRAHSEEQVVSERAKARPPPPRTPPIQPSTEAPPLPANFQPQTSLPLTVDKVCVQSSSYPTVSYSS